MRTLSLNIGALISGDSPPLVQFDADAKSPLTPLAQEKVAAMVLKPRTSNWVRSSRVNDCGGGWLGS